MKFQFDPGIDVTWGIYGCMKCKCKFYDEYTPSHLDGCSAANTADKDIVYRYGSKEVREVLLTGESRHSRLKVSDLSVEAVRSVGVSGVEVLSG